MSIISMVLVVVVAFLAGLEGILDQFQFHQPLVACTLIGLVTGNLTAGIMLGGSLQFIALGWANIGAAVAPDAALASVAAAIIMVLGGDFSTKGIAVAQSVAIPLAVAGLFLTMIVRTLSVGLVHTADAAARKGDIKGVERAHFVALLLQGLRIAIPAALLLMIPAETVKTALEAPQRTGQVPDGELRHHCSLRPQRRHDALPRHRGRPRKAREEGLLAGGQRRDLYGRHHRHHPHLPAG